MKRSSQIALCVVAGVLAIALVVSLVGLNNYKKTSQEQYNILRINSAFYYMRDVYLKGSTEERGENYAFLTTLAESLHSDDAQAQAVADLVMAVRNNVPPDSSHATELYEKIDNIEIFTDTRGDTCKISVDVDEVSKLINEINQYQPE